MYTTPEFDESLIKLSHIDVEAYPVAYDQQHTYEYAAPPPMYPAAAANGLQTPPFHDAYYPPVSHVHGAMAPQHTFHDTLRINNEHDAVPHGATASGSSLGGDTDEDDEEEDIDTSKMSKEELRKHKNRQSAARSRKRSRNRMEQLEQRVRMLTAKNTALEEQVRVLLMEREAVLRHRGPLVPQQPMHSPYYHN